MIRGPVGPPGPHNRPLRVQGEGGGADLKLPHSRLQERVGTYRLVYHSVLSPKRHGARKEIKRGESYIYPPRARDVARTTPYSILNVSIRKIIVIIIIYFLLSSYRYYLYAVFIWKVFPFQITKCNLKHFSQSYFTF